jgi:hypothetical protein
MRTDLLLDTAVGIGDSREAWEFEIMLLVGYTPWAPVFLYFGASLCIFCGSRCCCGVAVFCARQIWGFWVDKGALD